MTDKQTLQILFEKLSKVYDRKDIANVKIKFGTCPFCRKWLGIFHISTKDNVKLIYCPSCHSIHKTLTFSKKHHVKTYIKGRRFEYQVKKLLEEHGFTVFRCASSKPLDLVAFRLGKVLVCECKTGLVTKLDRQKIGEWSVKLGFPVVLFTRQDGAIQVEVFEPNQRREWNNTFQLLEDFLQFLCDNHSQAFPDGDYWVNLSQLDVSQTVWKFLFGNREGENREA